MRPETRRRNNARKQKQASKDYFKNNKAGDAGGQDDRPQPNDDQIIFSDYRKNRRITASKGGMKSRYGYEKGGKVEMHTCKPN